MNYQAPEIEWIDQNKLDENKVETEEWHRSIAETLIHAYQIMESMTEQNKVMVHYYNKQTRKGEPYISCPNFNDVSEAKEWVEQIHYPSALIKAGFKPVGQEVLQEQHSDWIDISVEPDNRTEFDSEVVLAIDVNGYTYNVTLANIVISGETKREWTECKAKWNGEFWEAVEYICQSEKLVAYKHIPNPPSEVQDETQ